MRYLLLFVLCVIQLCGAETDPRINEVLTYWFGDLESPGAKPEQNSKIWFSGGPAVDNEIKERFEKLVSDAGEHKLDQWKETPNGRLALIILLDQFPRNIYRGNDKAFAFDKIGEALAIEGINLGDDRKLLPIERVFLYLPLEHSESLKTQELSILKFRELAEENPSLNGYADYAQKHYVVIERFGRFPHRNKILGRESTSEEIEFLKGPNSSF